MKFSFAVNVVVVLIDSKVDYCNSVLAGIPGQLQDRLQSVLNAAACLVFSARRSECITPLLCEIHWLRVPERVTVQLCVLAYRCLHGTAPAYLAKSLLRTSNIDTRRCLRSADSGRRSTLNDCTFPVASACAWNSLPSSFRNASSLTTFNRELKTVLFRSSFDNDLSIVIVLHSITVVWPRLLTVGDSVVFCLLFFLILYGAPAMSLTW